MKILGIVLMFVIASCAHHHNKVPHHHHKFEKNCAYEVGQNHFDVLGKEEFKLEHEGETYYFSSKEKRELLLKNLERNIEKSNHHWKARGIKRS